MPAPAAIVQFESILSWDTCRLWSLWEMLELKGQFFHDIVTAIQHTVTYVNTQVQYHPELLKEPVSERDHDVLPTMLRRLERLDKLLGPMGAIFTLEHVKRLKFDLEKTPDKVTFEEMAKHFAEINQRFRDELKIVKMFITLPENAKYYTEGRQLFGDQVEKRLPQLTEDIYEAGICIAFARPTAAVFHLMRVLETGVQRLGSKLGVGLAAELNWQVILDQVNKSIKALDHRKSETKQLAEIAANLYAVKVAWRNEVMHPKQTYTLDQAKAIFDASGAFMRELVEVL